MRAQPKRPTDRWGEFLKLKYHFTLLCGTNVRLYHSIHVEKSNVRGRHSLWVAHTLDSIHSRPTFGAQGALFQVAISLVTLSHYASALNESTNDRASSLIGESKPKDRFDRWENLSSLSTTPHSFVEPM